MANPLTYLLEMPQLNLLQSLSLHQEGMKFGGPEHLEAAMTFVQEGPV